MFKENKKKQYLDCPFMKHSLHFFFDEIRACCTNSKGPVFYPNYNGETVDWNKIYKIRKEYVNKINGFWANNYIPDNCLNCCEISSHLSDKKNNKFDNLINTVYFHTSMSCNAKCIYCTYANVDKGYKYKVMPMVYSLIQQKLLSKNAQIYMSGGEPTILPEFEELFSLLQDYLQSKIMIFTSGIKYSESIKEAFIKHRCNLLISLDSGTKDTYHKIKGVDCFEKVVNNLENYISATKNDDDGAINNIILKYILVENFNDNLEEIKSFVELVSGLGIKKVRLDLDFNKYKLSGDINLPEHYPNLFNQFEELTKQHCLNIEKYSQVEEILKKNNIN